MLAVTLLMLAAVALAVAAGRDFLARPQGPDRPPGKGLREAVPPAAKNLGLPERLRRAGKADRFTPRSILLVKVLTGGTGLMTGLIFAPLLPGRFGPVMLFAAAAFGFFLPDLMLERTAKRRHRRMVAALPDALDLLSVSVSTGRSLSAGLQELARSGRGPLAAELGLAGEDMAWGSSQKLALDQLRQRVRGKEIAALCSSLERSRKLGSPLAEQLRRQSAGLRQDQRRLIEEEAARAAPKIQLVIALILVPSVLLLIVAALVANSDALLGAGL